MLNGFTMFCRESAGLEFEAGHSQSESQAAKSSPKQHGSTKCAPTFERLNRLVRERMCKAFIVTRTVLSRRLIDRPALEGASDSLRHWLREKSNLDRISDRGFPTGRDALVPGTHPNSDEAGATPPFDAPCVTASVGSLPPQSRAARDPFGRVPEPEFRSCKTTSITPREGERKDTDQSTKTTQDGNLPRFMMSRASNAPWTGTANSVVILVFLTVERVAQRYKALSQVPD